MPFEKITPAKMAWLPDGTPFSERFDDIYFSRAGGEAETRHVFLSGNNLPNRWSGRRHFTIIETGFGTGLNFLTTLKEWQATRQPGQWLYFISIEKHPIRKEDLTKILPAGNILLDHYPDALPGFHYQPIDKEQVTLLLIHADMETALQELSCKADAWFLDGFAPARNPEMWTPELFKQMNRLSAADATAATYTVARAVRDGLVEAGFKVEKAKGFGHKRDMVRAYREGNAIIQNLPAKVSVIGGGLAGCSTAYALAKRGVNVDLHERHPKPAMEASGNPVAILNPYLAREWSAQTLLYSQAFHFTRNLLTHSDFTRWQASGILQLSARKHTEEWQKEVIDLLGLPEDYTSIVSAKSASEHAGIPLNRGGLWFKQGAWMEPSAFCEWMLKSSSIMSHFTNDVSVLENDVPTVLANAKDAKHFIDLPLIPVRGQLSFVSNVTAQLPLKTILSYAGYALPNGNDLCLGATFDSGLIHDDLRESDHDYNIGIFSEVLASEWKPNSPVTGRVAYRTRTPNRLPLLGELEENLWTLLALGSRGATLAPLLGECIASLLTGTVLPIPLSVMKAINARRFQ